MSVSEQGHIDASHANWKLHVGTQLSKLVPGPAVVSLARLPGRDRYPSWRIGRGPGPRDGGQPLRALGESEALRLGGIGTDSKQGKLPSVWHGLDAKTQLKKGVGCASGGGKTHWHRCKLELAVRRQSAGPVLRQGQFANLRNFDTPYKNWRYTPLLHGYHTAYKNQHIQHIKTTYISYNI